jgi:hypothetical protein
MQFNLNTEQQDAILYAVTFALSNQIVNSQETLNNLYEVLDMFKAEEDKRYFLEDSIKKYNLHSGTHEGL